MMSQDSELLYLCAICGSGNFDRRGLVEHLAQEHVVEEALFFAAATMAAEESRDRFVAEYSRKIGLMHREPDGQRAGQIEP
jgi:hypothetical protein